MDDAYRLGSQHKLIIIVTLQEKHVIIIIAIKFQILWWFLEWQLGFTGPILAGVLIIHAQQWYHYTLYFSTCNKKYAERSTSYKLRVRYSDNCGIKNGFRYFGWCELHQVLKFMTIINHQLDPLELNNLLVLLYYLKWYFEALKKQHQPQRLFFSCAQWNTVYVQIFDFADFAVSWPSVNFHPWIFMFIRISSMVYNR